MEKFSEIIGRIKAGDNNVDRREVASKLLQQMAQGADPDAAQREMVKREADRAFGLGVFETPSVLEHYRLLRATGDLSGFLIQMSGLHGFESKTFEAFKKRTRYPTVQEAVEAVKGFVKGGPPILTMAGGVGSGKSHLLMAAGWELIGRGVLVLYRTQQQLESDIKRAMDERRYETALDDVLNCPFLLIDDLGMSTMTNWSQGFFDTVIDHRWSHRLPLAVATNLQSHELPARMADRLGDRSVARVVQISAESYRKTGGKQ